MKIIVFDKNTKKGEFLNYGYGKLKSIEKCEVVEEINGRYDAEILLNRCDSKHVYIQKWAILYIDGQLFRVVSRSDVDRDNNIKIFAKHIFYDIGYGFIVDSRADNKTIQEAMEIAIPIDFKDTFKASSDITDLNTLYFVKNNGVESMLGIIDRWQKGEIVRDNFNIAINESKGADNGVTFTYKKIDAIEINEETDNVVTRLFPTGKDGITLEEYYVTIPNWSQEEYPPFHITKEVKFEGVESTGELRTLAKKEAERIGLSKVNFKINVNALEHTELNKHIPALSNVEVGDIVTIKHNKLNVRVKVKCIKKVVEKVSKKITLEFGQPLDNFFSNVDNSNNVPTIPDTSKYEDHMFFWFNDSSISLNKTENELCYIRYGVSDKTNLMLYFNMFFTCESNCTAKIILKIDNVDLTFSPEFSLEKGNRSISFTYPMIGTEGGQSHTFKPIIQLSDGSNLFVEKENIQIVIKGQNVSGIMKEPPHADVEEVIKLNKITIGDISTAMQASVSKLVPGRVNMLERLKPKTLRLKPNKLVSNVDVMVISRGYTRPIEADNYIYNTDTIEVKDTVMLVKNVTNISSSKVSDKQFEKGVLHELELVDKNLWSSVEESVFIE